MEGELIHSPIISMVMIILFVIWYVFILSEEKLKLNKAKPILFVGGIMWMILYVFFDAHIINEHFNHTIMEIANLFFFLMSAMTFIVLLEKTNFFEKVALKLLPPTISLKKLFIIIWLFTFCLSAIADNLTATLVVLSLILTFTMETKDKLKLSALVIWAANIWGTFLITWDVTTLMIFVKGKVTILGLLKLFLPSLIAFFSLFALLSYKLKWNITFPKKNIVFYPEKIKIFIIFIATIISVITLHVLFHIPAVLTFLTWLWVMAIFTWKHEIVEDKDEGKKLSTLDSIGEVEIDALMFFVWVLLAVWALSTVGVLEYISKLYESSPDWIITYFVWIFSAIVDNIPLTASILWANPDIDYLLLTYSVWVGGNLLIIGSAAWVVAMSKVKELTFMTYLKYFSLPMLISYTIGFVLTYYFCLLF